MKRAIVSLILAAVAVLSSCGGSSSSSSQNSTSNLKTRAFVTNSYSGVINLIDYTKDQQLYGGYSVGTDPQMMVLTPDRKYTLIFDAGTNGVNIFDNTTETSITTVQLPSWTNSIVVSPDSKKAWVAVRNAPQTSGRTGEVDVIDMSDFTKTSLLGTPIPVPLVTHLALSPDGTKLLAFSDPTVPVATPLSIIDTSTGDVLAQPTAGLDRPDRAVFSSDGSKAYIANCGPECGGTTASVGILDVAAGQMTGTPVQAPATVLLLDGSTLYAAGNVPGDTFGTFTAITVNGTTLTTSKTVQISDGDHTEIMKASSNKIFVGANPCSNVDTPQDQPGRGCLSIYDTGSGTAVVDHAKGFVTGMAQVPNRNVVYVIEGGELLIYDTTTSAELTGHIIDILGAAYDVEIVDQ